MNKIPALSAIRLIPRESSYLDRRLGSRGEIFYDQDSNTLRLYNGQISGGFKIAKTDLANVPNETFLAKAIAAGVGGGAGGNFELSIVGDDSTELTITEGNTLSILGDSGISTTTDPATGEVLITNSSLGFFRVAVDGEGNIDADQLEDVLNIEAGDNISLSIDSETKTLTITATAQAGGNSFATVSVATQSSVVADSASDTLTLAAGSGISITTDASTDTITITNTLTSFSFDQLVDVSAASLDVDQVYLPAITRLSVTNSGASAYVFDQYVGSNPTIYAIGGTTIAFKLLASGHPFLIQDSEGNNYNTGLVHVTNTGIVTTGSNAQGKDSGTLYWKIPGTLSGNYRYQCSVHVPMVGGITVKNIVTI
jgi:plastocyanin